MYVPMLGKAVTVVAVRVRTISSVIGCERFLRHRARSLRLPSATWSADAKEVVEGVLTLSQRSFQTENVMKPKLVVPIVIAMALGFVNLSASAFTRSSPMGQVVPQLG